MRFPPVSSIRCWSVASVMLASAAVMQAQVLPLDFVDGNGTSSVDQFTAIAGSGWKTPWTVGAGTNVVSHTETVTNVDPLASGGNYLNVNFLSNSTASDRWVRVSRQIDSAAISLSSPVAISFTLRPDSTVSNGNLTFTIFGGTAATNNTGPSDTWKITADGGGWNVYNGATAVGIGRVGATSLTDTDYRFTILSDPTTRTYVVTVDNLTNNSTLTTGVLNWRSTASTENSYLNFVAQAGSAASFGYSLDNVTVVPEPGVLGLVGIAGVALLGWRARRRA